jgi:hypothetical protein
VPGVAHRDEVDRGVRDRDGLGSSFEDLVCLQVCAQLGQRLDGDDPGRRRPQEPRELPCSGGQVENGADGP